MSGVHRDGLIPQEKKLMQTCLKRFVYSKESFPLKLKSDLLICIIICFLFEVNWCQSSNGSAKGLQISMDIISDDETVGFAL